LNSLEVKGVCSRIYRNADIHLGYYESGKPAFFNGDSGTNLSINVLFKTEENVRFESHLLGEEAITINSPMNILVIIANVMEIVLILLLMLWRS